MEQRKYKFLISVLIISPAAFLACVIWILGLILNTDSSSPLKMASLSAAAVISIAAAVAAYYLLTHEDQEAIAAPNIAESKANLYENDDFYKNMPSYTGANVFYKAGEIPSFLIVYIIIIIILFATPLLSYFIPVNSRGFAIQVLQPICIGFFAILGRTTLIGSKITIDGFGVRIENKTHHSNYFISWDEVHTISILKKSKGKNVIHFHHGRAAQQQEDIKPFKIEIPYSPRTVHCILQYWEKEIWNLEVMRSWNRYVDKL